MGYEITSTDSIYKAIKFTSRGLVRKDSPLRLKQIKQKLVSTDSDKLEKDEETDVTNASEVDIQCERENELLTKIAEELEYSENVTIDTDVQMCNSVEDESINAVPMPNKTKINNLNVELEITQDSTFSKHVEPTFTSKIGQSQKDESLEVSKDCNVSLESNEFDHSMTQEDMFIGIATKHNDFVEERTSDVDTSAVQNTSIMNNSLDLLKYNVQDNSIIKHSSEKHANSECLDDTIDAGNLTALNSSANSDEIFCGKLIRTSTQATENTQENMQEQDTLPVTDSVFGSLPSSQDNQNTSEFNVETPHPELLDTIQPIYPTLILCKEPITSIIDHLTNPLWVQHLLTYFKHRNVQTIGDLAQLSEREINRIPVKSNSKVEFVKNVLKCFEKKHAEKVSKNNEVSCSVNINVPASTRKVTTEDQAIKSSTDEIRNELINHIPLSQPSSSTVFNNVIIDKNACKMVKETTESASNELSNMPTVDASKANSQAMYEVAQTTGSESSNATTTYVNNSIKLCIYSFFLYDDCITKFCFYLDKLRIRQHHLRLPFLHQKMVLKILALVLEMQ